MCRDIGESFLFSDDRNIFGNEGDDIFFYTDGSGYYHGDDGSDGYIYSDGSGYFHGVDGSDGYRYADGSGYFTDADGITTNYSGDEESFVASVGRALADVVFFGVTEAIRVKRAQVEVEREAEEIEQKKQDRILREKKK